MSSGGGPVTPGWLAQLLPADVADLVFQYTFPRVRMRCATCGVSCLEVRFDGMLEQTRSYKVLEHVVRCLPCEATNESHA